MASDRETSTDGQVLKGLLDTLVLKVLAAGDNYGLGILERVAAEAGPDVLLRDATLYPILHRLESRGQVEAYFAPGQRGTPRKYYRLTDAGRRLLAERIAEWQRVSALLDRFVFA